MPWVALDDGFPEHPKVAGLTDRQFRVFVEGLCYARRARTDGHLTPAVATRIGGSAKVAAALVDAGLWEVNGNGWVIHDYADWQRRQDPTNAERQKRYRERRRNGDGNADGNGGSNGA